MDTDRCLFNHLLSQHNGAIERFVYYKIPVLEDARDILQEVQLTAFLKFDTLKDCSKFKAWLIKIAANKCNDYFRKQFTANEIPLEDVCSYTIVKGYAGVTVKETVNETINNLGSNDKNVLHLYYFREMTVKDIAKKLEIPEGTVKSRLNTARNNFRRVYPYPPQTEGESIMVKTLFPEKMPDIEINKSDMPVFAVVFAELPGWFIIPRLGEKTSWAMYDYPVKKRTEIAHCEVIGKAQIHGIDCVEVSSGERTLYARLSDTHVQYLADSHYHGDVKVMTTFLDDDFLKNWGIGDDNCGREINIKPTGNIRFNEDGSIYTKKPKYIDVLGVYEIKLGERVYQTLKIVESSINGICVESYIDRTGRTVLWRRYNKNDWYVGENKHYKVPWTKQLPENIRLVINGETYVHWYDCISDYVL